MGEGKGKAGPAEPGSGGGERQGRTSRTRVWGEQGGDAQTHVKELSRDKGVVGNLPLLGAPGAVHKAVANHGLTHAGVDVESYVPGGPHLEVDDKTEDR